MRHVQPLCLTLLLLANALPAQQAEPGPTPQEATADWSTFDPAAAIAAVSEPPQELPFKRLWTTKERVRLFKGLAISANGHRLLALAPNGRCRVYDGDSGKMLAEVAEDLGLVTHTALSRDGSRGAIGLVSNEVVTFDTASGKVLHRHPPEGAAAKSRTLRLTALQFSADGRHVSWLVDNGQFQRAELASGQRMEHSFVSPDYEMTTRLNALSPDGLVAATEPVAESMKLSYLVLPEPGSSEQPQILVRKYGDEPLVALALSQNLLATQTLLGRLVVQSHPHKREPPGGRKSSISTNHLTATRTGLGPLAISADEKWLLSVGRGHAEIRRLDVPDLPSLHNVEIDSAAQTAISVDALRIAAVDQDGHLTVAALAEHPDLPEWKLQTATFALLRDKQFELLDKLSDLMQDDPASFTFDPSHPRYRAWINQMLREDGWNRPMKRGLLKQWLTDRPDSKLARLLLVRQLVHEGWAARGSGTSDTVSELGWNILNERTSQAHTEIKKLLAHDRPPPESFLFLFEIAKAQSWSEEQCMEQASRVAELSPQYLTPHLSMVEKLLMRWGGEAHSSALYSAWVSDKIRGPDGDALYAQLILRIGAYEEPPLLTEHLGIDWERAFKGARALQEMPQRRTLGVIMEAELASLTSDTARLPRLAQIIDREKTPFFQRNRLTRLGFDRLYRENVDRVAPMEENRNASRGRERPLVAHQ